MTATSIEMIVIRNIAFGYTNRNNKGTKIEADHIIAVVRYGIDRPKNRRMPRYAVIRLPVPAALESVAVKIGAELPIRPMTTKVNVAAVVPAVHQPKPS